MVQGGYLWTLPLGFVVLLPLIPKLPVDNLEIGAILVIVGIVAGPCRY